MHPRLWLVSAVLLAAASCGSSGCAALVTPTPTPFVISTRYASVLIGRAVIVDGCFRVVIAMPPYDSHLLVWPPEYRVTVEGDGVRIADYLGQVTVLRAGQTVRLGGGMTGQDYMRQQLRPGMPPDCPGPYWVVGDIAATAVPAATLTAMVTVFQPRITAFPAATLTGIATVFGPP